MAHLPLRSLPGVAVRRDGRRDVARALPEEVPVALVFQGSTQAVMMATPADIEDFAWGFARSEGLVTDPAQVHSLEIDEHDSGIEARFWLEDGRAAALAARRRAMLGPVGCGLCGIDSLEQALRALPVLPEGGLRLAASEVAGATEALRALQPLHDQTHALHAAGFLVPGQGIVLAREDVGRHNALDKLLGALWRQGIDPSSGAVVLTSRVSVELVQKTVVAGATALIAVSAPTAHALRLADAARLTLVAFARAGGFDVYAHPQRIDDGVTDVF